jgi:adenylylsulfate kinase-like enzyme
MVIWIIGKSGVGKTFIAEKIYKKIKKNFKKIKWVDGDRFRKKFSKDLGFSINDRRKNSIRIQRYCKKFENENYLVICSLISIFPDHQKKNRKLFTKYIQIYVKASNAKIQKRNKKGIYKKKINVVGRDIKFPKPFKSDIIIYNSFKKKILSKIKKIENKINEKL